VGIDHGRANILVAQQFVHRTDVVAVGQPSSIRSTSRTYINEPSRATSVSAERAASAAARNADRGMLLSGVGLVGTAELKQLPQRAPRLQPSKPLPRLPKK
jgi:hypothetical protein